MGNRKNKYRRIFLLYGLSLFACTFSVTGYAAEGQTEKTEDTAQDLFAEETVSLDRWQENLESPGQPEMMFESVRGVRVVQDGETALAVSYEPREYKNSYDCWTVSAPYHSLIYVDTEYMYQYFEHVEELNLCKEEAVSTQSGTEEGMETFGLADSDTSLFIAWYSGQTEEGGQAEPDCALTLQIGAPDGQGHYYVEDVKSGEIYLAEASAVEELLSPDPYDFVLKVVNIVSRETVSSLEISVEGEEFLMKEEEGSCYLNDREVDDAAYQELYTAILSCFIEAELPEDFRPEADRTPLLKLVYHRNMEDAPEITLAYYPYDEEYVTAWINGQEFFLVSREEIESLMEKIREAF